MHMPTNRYVIWPYGWSFIFTSNKYSTLDSSYTTVHTYTIRIHNNLLCILSHPLTHSLRCSYVQPLSCYYVVFIKTIVSSLYISLPLGAPNARRYCTMQLGVSSTQVAHMQSWNIGSQHEACNSIYFINTICCAKQLTYMDLFFVRS